jgi:hypothetical protein
VITFSLARGIQARLLNRGHHLLGFEIDRRMDGIERLDGVSWVEVYGFRLAREDAIRIQNHMFMGG